MIRNDMLLVAFQKTLKLSFITKFELQFKMQVVFRNLHVFEWREQISLNKLGKSGKGDAPYLHYRISGIFFCLPTWINNEAECSSRSLMKIYIFIQSKVQNTLVFVFLFTINIINNLLTKNCYFTTLIGKNSKISLKIASFPL